MSGLDDITIITIDGTEVARSRHVSLSDLLDDDDEEESARHGVNANVREREPAKANPWDNPDG